MQRLNTWCIQSRLRKYEKKINMSLWLTSTKDSLKKIMKKKFHVTVVGSNQKSIFQMKELEELQGVIVPFVKEKEQ